MRLVDAVVPVMTTVLPVAAVRSTAVAEAMSAPVERVCKPVKVLVPRVAAAAHDAAVPFVVRNLPVLAVCVGRGSRVSICVL